jgi:hypothetical protein
MNFKISFLLLLSLLGITSEAQTQSGYMPFHEYVLKNHGNIQKRSDVSRSVVVFDKIGYTHYTLQPDTQPADSGVFNYNKSANVVWETNGLYTQYGRAMCTIILIQLVPPLAIFLVMS